MASQYFAPTTATPGAVSTQPGSSYPTSRPTPATTTYVPATGRPQDPMRIKCVKCGWWHRKDLPCRNTGQPGANTRKPRVNMVAVDESSVYHGEFADMDDEVAAEEAEARLEVGEYVEEGDCKESDF